MIDEIMINHYKKLKEISHLKCDIEVLEKNIDFVKSYKTDNKYIQKRIKENINVLVCKKLLLDALMWEVSTLERILSALEDDEKRIIELRYRDKKNYKEIIGILNISKSKYFRMLNITLLYIEKKLEEKREY